MIKTPKLILSLLASLFLFTTAFSQSDKERIDAYVSQYGELAVKEMIRTGVPASITLAQGIHETAGGQSDLASIAHNHFGIKCKGEWTGETMSHDDDAKGECFRKYPCVEDSYKDHSDFLKTRPNYAFLFKLDPTDYEGWAVGLKKAGYATNPAYSQKLIKIIVENNLQQYTLDALQRLNRTEGELFSVKDNANKKAKFLNVEATPTSMQSVSLKQQTSSFAHSPATKKDQYPTSVFNINTTRVVYAEKGTSLLALANNYNIALKKLFEFNELEESEVLAADQLIFLGKKPKRGTKDFHIVEQNESLHDIAQKEGVQLASVLEFNGLQKGMQPAIGEKLYLKAAAPSSPRLAIANTSFKSSNM